MNVNDERKRRIRERAYEIWERKGRPAGQQDQHWYEAERSLAWRTRKMKPVLKPRVGPTMK